MKKSNLTKALVRELFDYNPETGQLIRATTLKGIYKAGDIVSSLDVRGYLRTKIGGRSYKAHRLIWFWVHGEFPKKDLDHINHDKTDNRLVNLREVTAMENARNKPKSNRNKSGVTGVYWGKNDNRWRVFIGVDGKKVNLGNFVEFHEAVNARKNAEVLYGFHENHGKDNG